MLGSVPAPSTDEAVTAGFGVLDGGATKTMASIHALECLEQQCKEQQLPGIVKVDTSDRPLFGFGNSDQNRCVSTCYVRLPTQEQPMSLRIHALDQGRAPVLISVDTLRKLGAIIDFKNDEAVFTQVNAQKLISLRRSSAGHQLIPLTQDFMAEGRVFPRAAQSLAQLLNDE